MLKAVYPSGEDDEYTFYQGNGIHMFRETFNSSILSMGICALIIMLSICMIVYWALLCRKSQVAKDLLYMGIFVLLLGIWLLGNVNGFALLFDCRPYASYFSYTLLMLMGSTFLLFVKYFLLRFPSNYMHIKTNSRIYRCLEHSVFSYILSY